MEDKTRKLVMVLEAVALVTAGILILIDYKLKQDLLRLFERIESAIETGNRLFPQDASERPNPSRVPTDTVVGDNPRVGTPTNGQSANGSTRSKPRPSRGKATNGSGGTRDSEIPESSKPVGS